MKMSYNVGFCEEIVEIVNLTLEKPLIKFDPKTKNKIKTM